MSELKEGPVTTDLIKQAVINEVRYVLNREDFEKPQNAVFERKNHLIYSNNLKSADKVKMIATGYPDGPLMFSRTTGVTLREVFEKTVKKDQAFAQVYLGGRPADLKKYPKYLGRALELVADDAEVDLFVYSAGAMSLVGRDMDKRINKITFISPFIGRESLKGDPEACAAYIFGGVVDVPKIDEYFDSINTFVRHVIDRDKEVAVEVGTQDKIISSDNVINGFRERFFDKVEIRLNERAHAPSQSEIDSLLD